MDLAEAAAAWRRDGFVVLPGFSTSDIRIYASELWAKSATPASTPARGSRVKPEESGSNHG
jgi:hypothetical protein